LCTKERNRILHHIGKAQRGQNPSMEAGKKTSKEKRNAKEVRNRRKKRDGLSWIKVKLEIGKTGRWKENKRLIVIPIGARVGGGPKHIRPIQNIY